MLKKQIIPFFFLLGGLSILSSCTPEEGCTDPNATNYNTEAEDDDGSCIYEEEVELVVPNTYAFSRNGENTVDFTGQAQRLEMLEEMTNYMKTANTPGTVVEYNVLLDMYANAGYTWFDDLNLDLNGSTKQLENKTAAASGTPDAVIVAQFKDFMEQLEAASQSTVSGQLDGTNGQAGVVQSNTDPSKQYLMDANGVEHIQYIEKGLMGAVFYNQIQMVYLAPGKMDVDNSTAVDADNGKFYTAMEHHWDEAFGYFTTATDFPASGTDRFWGKYADGRESVLGSASKLSEAFRTGRAAIAANDLVERDIQINLVREELEKVAAGTAIHYLNVAMDNFADDALRNHQLSEAWAFIMAIPYGHEPSLTLAQAEDIIATMGDNYYEVTLADLQATKDALASLTGLSAVADQL